LQRQLEGVQTIRPRGAEDDSDQDDNGHGGGRMMGSWHHRDWGRGAMGRGMMDRGGMMGPGSMGRGMSSRRLTSGYSGGWTQTKMAASAWRRSRPSCRVPEDRFPDRRTLTRALGDPSCLSVRPADDLS
jgi:hypothetical protein